MTFFLGFLYVIACLFLIAVVLLQTGKRADLAGAFGGGGSQTAFGTRGAATMLTRMTTISAIAFMVLALSLSILYRGGRDSEGTVLDQVEPNAATQAPATGEPPAAPIDAVPTETEGEPVPPTETPGS